jgi:hypothetical protein
VNLTVTSVPKYVRCNVKSLELCGDLSLFPHHTSVAGMLTVGHRLTNMLAAGDWWLTVINQSTKKLTTVGVRRRRETSSLIRFNHSCVRKALLEMVNGALN